MHTTHTTQTTNTNINYNTVNKLRVFTTNVRGLIKNWNILNQIKFENYDILLFNEIWQIKEFENINIDEFRVATLFQRENRRGGGVIIYVRENIEFKVKDSPIE